MRGSSILGWGRGASILHQPLPLSARDSRHLLSLLNTSFTEALDKEHPKVSSEGRNTTDEHVHSILSNPIFGPIPSDDNNRPSHPPPSKKCTPPKASGLSKSMIPGPVDSISIANAMIEAHVKAFRNHIFTGRANLALATACLRYSTNYMKSIDKKHRFEAFKGFGKHGMASMMLSWLWSSGLEKSDEVLFSVNFLPLLSPFLLAEGRLEEAMQWFRRLGTKATLYSRCVSLPMDSALAVCLENVERSKRQLLATFPQLWDSIESSEVRRACVKVQLSLRGGYLSGWPRMHLRERQQAMLHYLVLYSLAQGSNKSLNSAISIFVHAMDSSNVAGMSAMELISVFRPTGAFIVKQIGGGLKADQSGYDAFSSTVPFWNNTNDSVHCGLVRSIIKLHDPNNPDWGPAYLFLSKLTSTIVKRFTLWERRSTVSLGLDTAKVILSDGRYLHAHRAKKIMERLQQHFGDELGVLAKSMEETRNSQHAGQLEPMETDFALAM